MRPKEYRVELTDEERTDLLLLIRQGKTPARTLQRAHILLRADEGAFDHQSASALHLSLRTIQRVRQRFAQAPGEERLSLALYDRPRPGAAPKLDTTGEAVLIALACSKPPEERECWTMQLLADRLVELRVVESISDETVRVQMKKTRSSPGRSSTGAFQR